MSSQLLKREGGAFINKSEDYHHLYNRLNCNGSNTTTSSITMTTGQDEVSAADYGKENKYSTLKY